jgi:hypothetical protein
MRAGRPDGGRSGRAWRPSARHERMASTPVEPVPAAMRARTATQLPQTSAANRAASSEAETSAGCEHDHLDSFRDTAHP